MLSYYHSFVPKLCTSTNSTCKFQINIGAKKVYIFVCKYPEACCICPRLVTKIQNYVIKTLCVSIFRPNKKLLDIFCPTFIDQEVQEEYWCCLQCWLLILNISLSSSSWCGTPSTFLFVVDIYRFYCTFPSHFLFSTSFFFLSSLQILFSPPFLDALASLKTAFKNHQ